MGETRVLPQRRSVRLQGYDYASAGACFVTVCAHGRRCIFGDVVGGKMVASEIGNIVERTWQALPDHFPGVELDQFVLMPNHVHGIVIILGETGRRTGDACVVPTQQRPGPQRRSMAAIVGSFKSAAAREIHRFRGTPSGPIWQRNYYEHVIRDEYALNQIRQHR